ncbi:MAG: class II fructose-bisphosphate aldolase [Clostridia bacterium]|nr:class II fructose-bisphosphate aldolase [Clostridia bacterium]
MLVSLTELMKDAEEKGYAVGAFNACNYESAVAVIKAAEETGQGIVFNWAEVHAPLISMDEVAPLMIALAKKATVPVCVHLDHGSSVESCIKAIQLGFTSVMLDASSADYEENVKETALICRLAHSVGVTVEAELGHIFASNIGVGETKNNVQEDLDCFDSEEDVYTNPDTAKDFVERTGVDALAIAFGTAHGVYQKKPKLDLDRIKKVKEKANIPLVMHGGSGLTKEEFQTAIKNGIRKINYYTYMSLEGGKAVKEYIEKLPADKPLFYHDLPLIAIEAMKENVKQAIEIFSLKV